MYLTKYNMRATDIIRSVLDILDKAEESEPRIDIEYSNDQIEEPSRFKQILGMLTNPNEQEYANSPNEKYADIDTVTTLAGGGVNGPKHPDDIRVKDPSPYGK